MSSPPRMFPIFGLLFGAIVWGLIWYPYRLLEQAGISGIQSSLLTYGFALMVGVLPFVRDWRLCMRVPQEAYLIGMCAGWTNLSYVLAILHGEVMRVLLLFYMAPVWTLLLARLLLDERVSWRGLVVMAVSLSGMLTMLWQGSQLPLPRNLAEWLALSSGLAFAATNVLTRRAAHLTLRAKSIAVWAGVCVLTLLSLPLAPPFIPMQAISSSGWLLMAAIGVVLAITTWLVQYGLTHTPATRASVIFMFELVVAAVSSYWLAGEHMTLREWVGGALIVAAALYFASAGTGVGAMSRPSHERGTTARRAHLP
ncbi:MAG: DMT family transporter [Methylophilaceae bacterium]|nr:DMT family transporter [Methylophilaceae bacterium]